MFSTFSKVPVAKSSQTYPVEKALYLRRGELVPVLERLQCFGHLPVDRRLKLFASRPKLFAGNTVALRKVGKPGLQT